jgi:hypothetical protein
VREIRSPGSVRGVPGNRHSYRDTFGHSCKCVVPIPDYIPRIPGQDPNKD